MDTDHAPRDKRIPIRVTAEQHAILKRAADKAGLDLSSYMRAVALLTAREEEG